jgi:radical SAM superfamily enzyme YgiQ (UPF0313 family)
MDSARRRKLLLTSVCQPFGEKYGDGFGVSYEGSHQILWAQGIFRTRATTTQWGIDFIAENLDIPTVTLHYPTMRQFTAEIRKGYDYVGIAFVASTMHKMIPMVEAIRTHAPAAKIILGGYGTSMGEELTPFADYICQGEGVAFMRGLLGECLDQPITQPVITQTQSLLSMRMPGRTGYIFAGLGYPNGCDFCATSHYFKRRHIKFLDDGACILGAVEKLRNEYPEMTSFYISDEDFLLDERRGRGFLEAIRASALPPLSISVFSSVKALSQYTASELVEMGIGTVWVGYEGKRAGYKKMEGRPYRELLADLHDHGISVLTSMIIGFDYQTAETITQEYDELLSLRPSMAQYLIYGPVADTPLYHRLKSEGRLKTEAINDRTRHDGFSLGFAHPYISAIQMAKIQRRLYREEFERLGPAVFRVVDDWLAGYIKLRHHPAPRARAKALEYRNNARRCLPLIAASKRHVNRLVGAWLDELEQKLICETGPVTWREKMLARLAPLKLWQTHFKDRYRIGQQPESTRRSYRFGGAQKQQAVRRGRPLEAPQPAQGRPRTPGWHPVPQQRSPEQPAALPQHGAAVRQGEPKPVTADS